MTNELLNEINATDNGINNANIMQIIPSRLQKLVPSIGIFYTRLPLRKAFMAYNQKYGITKRQYICISFNEIRHILNLAQILAMMKEPKQEVVVDETAERQNTTDTRALEAWVGMEENTPRTEEEEGDDSKASHHHEKLERRDRSDSLKESIDSLSLLTDKSSFPGPKLICFDGDQTLYSDGSNFESSGSKLAKYLYLLLKHGCYIAVVTAAGYEYQTAKYELRLTGLLAYFKDHGLDEKDLERFYIFGGECNYLMRLGSDYKLKPVREDGPGGWMVSTNHNVESPGNWEEEEVTSILDMAEACFQKSLDDQNMRARIIRKKRSVGLIPQPEEKIPREALDETVLRIQNELETDKVTLPFCAFNGGTDAWLDVGNKRVGVQVLQSYLGIPSEETLHIGDQFLNTGNDFAARSVCPCVWITSPEETTYILKSILRLAGVPLLAQLSPVAEEKEKTETDNVRRNSNVDFSEVERRATRALKMDVYTGEYISDNISS